MLFKWLTFCPRARLIFREKSIYPMILIFEKRVREAMKKIPDAHKRDELNNIFRTSLVQKRTFEENLNEFVNKNFSAMLESERERERARREQHIDEEISNFNQFGVGGFMGGRASNDNSIHEQNNAPSHKIIGSSKKVIIPLLNLPNSNNQKDGTPTIISRSTRRLELLNKSSVSTSNREPSNKDRKISGSQYEANMSYLEEQFEPIINNKYEKYQTATESVKNLAEKLGEYFLSIDLGCLLKNKRNNQLDEVAKLTGLKDEIKILESVMLGSKSKHDFEISESDIKLSNYPRMHKKLNILKEDIFTERNRDEICSDESEETDLEKKENTTNMSLRVMLQKTGYKKTYSIYSKSIRIILNILYSCLRELNYESLESYESLVQQL